MTRLTLFKSSKVPTKPLILPGEMHAHHRTGEWVAIDFSDATRKGDWLHTGFGPNVTLLYVEEKRVIVPMGLRLRRSMLAEPGCLETLSHIFSDSATARLVLRICITGPNMLRIAPRDYFGTTGIRQRLEAALSKQLGRRTSPNLTAHALEFWRMLFRQLEDDLQTSSSFRRSARLETLADCKKGFAAAWRIEL